MSSLFKKDERQITAFPLNPENYLHKKFILKPGHRPLINNVHYDNESITDSIAQAAIKKDPAQANHFLNDKERKVIETDIAGRNSVLAAENAALDVPVEKEVALLIKDGDFEGAKKLAKTLLTEKTRAATLKAIHTAKSKSRGY